MTLPSLEKGIQKAHMPSAETIMVVYNIKEWIEPCLNNMLHSIPKGTPRLIKPDTRKLLDIKQLEDCVAKCKRLTAAERNWWSSFISNEKDYRHTTQQRGTQINCKESRT